jgi:hypothetical protein
MQHFFDRSHPLPEGRGFLAIRGINSISVGIPVRIIISDICEILPTINGYLLVIVSKNLKER